MRTTGFWLAFSILITGFFTLNIRAATYYVAADGTDPVVPYSSWATAATNIQDAVVMAQAGDTVAVNSGIYKYGGAMVYGASNRVALTNPIILLGVNGPQNTAIVGDSATYGGRCVYVGSNAIVTGFSLVDGMSGVVGDSIKVQSGGGAWCEASGIISNCVFGGTNFPNASGSYSSDGCGAVNLGGGDYGGTIYKSVFMFNTAESDGAAAAAANLIDCEVISNVALISSPALYQGTESNCIIAYNSIGAFQSTLYDCTIATNQSVGTSSCTNYGCIIVGNNFGGAIRCLLYNCVLSNNVAPYSMEELPNGGGGAAESTLYNCTIVSNSSTYYGGGVYLCALYNCLVMSNNVTTISPAGRGGGACYSILYNCTAVGNSAHAGGGTFQGTNYNCILYDNTIQAPAPIGTNYTGAFLFNCDTIPYTSGPGNITNDPAFVNPATGNYQLQSDSPCINSGDNIYVSTTNDLAGNPRISGGTVDMGAYEYQNPSSILSYAWAQQYGLPTDGSMDYSDLDGTGMPNWEKSIAELNPTDSTSVLAVAPPMATNNTSGITIIWQSVQYLHYLLQRSSDLSQPFATIQSNLVGQAGTSSYTDITATNSVPYFYRIGVQ